MIHGNEMKYQWELAHECYLMHPPEYIHWCTLDVMNVQSFKNSLKTASQIKNYHTHLHASDSTHINKLSL